MTTKNLKGDIFGGITAGIVALPLALAFGIQAFSGVADPSASSMGALAGLVGATFLGFFASLTGGTPSQISGPTGPMTVVTASLVGAAWAASDGNIGTVLVAMSLAGMCCGIFQIIFGTLRIGKYVRYIPYPVLSGFMSGIGVIIILQQIYPIVGLKSPVKTIDMLLQYPSSLAGGIVPAALLLGAGTIAIIELFPLVTKKVPSTLVALVAMTAVSLFLDLDDALVIGSIPAGIPVPFFAKPGLATGSIDWGTAISSAVVPGLTLACLGSIDTLLTSVVADNITKTKHDSNRELIGQGIGNAVAGLFCGIAGAGATMRTVVNVRTGGRTKLSGMVHAFFLLSILLGLGSLVKFVPLSVLAGILITVGVGIIDFKGFRDLRNVSKADAFVLIVVFAVTVFVDLLTAVAIGMVAACILFMKSYSDIVESHYEATALSNDTGNAWKDEESIPEDVRKKIYIVRVDGPLFFGSVTRFNELVKNIPADAENVIIRMKLIEFMDQSGLYALETAASDLAARGVNVYFTHMLQQPRKYAESIRLIPGLVPSENVYPLFNDCMKDLQRKLNLSPLSASNRKTLI